MFEQMARQAMRPDPLMSDPLLTPPGAGGRGPSYVVGLDLGQAQDFSALSVVERTVAPDPADPARAVRHFGVRALRRWRLGTPYTEVVEDVRALLAKPPLPGCPLVIDGTGVGSAVVEMFAKARLTARLVPVTITAGGQLGAAEHTPGKGWRVSKKDLVGVMQTLVQFERLQIAPGLAEAATLARELKMFRVKVTALGNETFEAWRTRDHDDLVLSVALACWWGQKGDKRPCVG